MERYLAILFNARPGAPRPIIYSDLLKLVSIGLVIIFTVASKPLHSRSSVLRTVEFAVGIFVPILFIAHALLNRRLTERSDVIFAAIWTLAILGLTIWHVVSAIKYPDPYYLVSLSGIGFLSMTYIAAWSGILARRKVQRGHAKKRPRECVEVALKARLRKCKSCTVFTL